MKDQGGLVEVPAVMYIPPNGLREQAVALIPLECKSAYDEMTARGCRLAAELLRTGEVAVYIEHDEGDFAIEVCPNGPEIREAHQRLFAQWDADEFDKWLESVRG